MKLMIILSFLTYCPLLFSQEPRVGHDELKSFLDCQIKSKNQTECAPIRSKRFPSQVREKSLEMKELKVDKTAVEDFGHPHAVDQHIEPSWQSRFPTPRGSAVPR